MQKRIHRKIKIGTAALVIGTSLVTTAALNIDSIHNTLQQALRA